MEHTFRENQKDFEQLRALITEDSSVGTVEMVFQDYTAPSFEETCRKGFTADRLEKYHQLLRRLHLKGVMRLGNDSVFPAGAYGLLLKGAYKGYLYTEDKPKRLEPVLDGLSGGNCDYLVKSLQGHWYLYLRDYNTGN